MGGQFLSVGMGWVMKGISMKKVYAIVIFILCCCMWSGCGKEEEAGYYDIQAEAETFYDVAGSLEDASGVSGNCVSVQFYKGEPVQLWALWEQGRVDIYLYRMDGSRELLLEDTAEDYFFGRMYLDQEGNFYHWQMKEYLMKVDASGKRLYSKKLEDAGIHQINSFCQLPDGRVYMAYEGENAEIVLGELDPATGEAERVSTVAMSQGYGNTYMGAGEGCLLSLDSRGVWEINMETGGKTQIFSLAGTTYVFAGDGVMYLVWDFRVAEDGTVELLWADRQGGESILESLQKKDVSAGKTRVSMRGVEFAGTDGDWFKKQVVRFNQTNDTWFIVLEEAGDADWEDYITQTGVEVGAGSGPDIFYGDILGDYVNGVVLKEGLADLKPYMEEKGIKEEDYFPFTFGCWRNEGKVYSVTVQADFLGAGGGLADVDVIKEAGEPDIQTLVDSLLSWPENAVYMKQTDARGVLGELLGGTDDLWGMVDWEAGTCDFGTALFEKILKVSKQYGYDPRNNYPSLVQGENYGLYTYLDSTRRESEGKVTVGTLFDDGCHGRVKTNYTLAVNANSGRKEGAWEFICFLLGEEVQAAEYTDGTYPVNRQAFDAMMEIELGKEPVIRNGNIVIRRKYELTEDRVKELKEIMEEARFFPSRTAAILDIIYDEAEDYFDGTKGAGEVAAIVNNRVGLYLEEHR